MENYESKHDWALRQITYHDWSSKDLTPEQHSKLTMLRPLRAACKECTMCRLGRVEQIHKSAVIEDVHVFSNMNPSKFVVVGQNPGFNECVKDEPFVGDAGEFFQEVIQSHGLNRRDFYITNTVKCHTPENRKPEQDEVTACEPFLRIELRHLKPHLVIALGAMAFEVLCPEATFSDSLGKVVASSKFGVNVYPVYHPSPRNMIDPGRKSRFEADMSVLCSLIKRLNGRAASESQPEHSDSV